MHDKNTRENLVDAGYQLLQSDGYFRASDAAVCDRAGAKSGASMRAHFKTKECFRLAVLEKEILRYSSFELLILKDPRSDSPVKRVRDFVGVNIRSVGDQAQRSGYLFANLAATLDPTHGKLRARLVAIQLEIETALQQTIKAAKMQGELTGVVNERTAASHIMAGIQQARLQARLMQSREKLQEFDTYWMKLLGLHI